MSFLIPCPNCGSRPADEFRFGGELRQSPAGSASREAWGAYLYERANVKGIQEEWWNHRLGCRRWFVATRDTRTNAILTTRWLDSQQGEADAEAGDTRSPAAAGDDFSGSG